MELIDENQSLQTDKHNLTVTVERLQRDLQNSQSDLDQARQQIRDLEQQKVSVERDNQVWKTKFNQLTQYIQKSQAEQAERIHQLTETIDQLQRLIEPTPPSPSRPQPQIETSAPAAASVGDESPDGGEVQ